jgi:hypothetical protein
MWRMVLLVGSGCMVGGGPVIAMRSTGKLAIGWDASSTAGGIGLQAGATYGIDAPDLGYFAFRAAAPIAPDDRWRGPYQLGIGTTLGYARAEGHGGGIGALWTQYLRGDLDSCEATPTVALHLGLRAAAGQIEYFVSAQVHRHQDICFD